MILILSSGSSLTTLYSRHLSTDGPDGARQGGPPTPLTSDSDCLSATTQSITPLVTGNLLWTSFPAVGGMGSPWPHGRTGRSPAAQRSRSTTSTHRRRTSHWRQHPGRPRCYVVPQPAQPIRHPRSGALCGRGLSGRRLDLTAMPYAHARPTSRWAPAANGSASRREGPTPRTRGLSPHSPQASSCRTTGASRAVGHG